MVIPDSCHEVVVPVAAGIIVSLWNRFILNNPSCSDILNINCSREIENIDVEEDMGEEKSGSSGALSSTLEVPHHNVHIHTH